MRKNDLRLPKEAYTVFLSDERFGGTLSYHSLLDTL